MLWNAWCAWYVCYFQVSKSPFIHQSRCLSDFRQLREKMINNQIHVLIKSKKNWIITTINWPLPTILGVTKCINNITKSPELNMLQDVDSTPQVWISPSKVVMLPLYFLGTDLLRHASGLLLSQAEHLCLWVVSLSSESSPCSYS